MVLKGYRGRVREKLANPGLPGMMAVKQLPTAAHT